MYKEKSYVLKRIQSAIYTLKQTSYHEAHPKPWPIRTAYFITTALQEPFVALYAMLAILLSKNLGATPFQIALLNMLKPTVSVLSFYWGSYLHSHTSLTKTSLITATAFAVLPFIFSPAIDSVWIFIFMGAWYSLFSRAAIPASLELLKLNTMRSEREKLFSTGSILAYSIGGVFALLYGFLLDYSPSIWHWLLCGAAIFHLISVYAQQKIPSPKASADEIISSVTKAAQESTWHEPWKRAKELMSQRPDFLRFQIGFSIAGFGLMFSQPAIPAFVTELNLSYIELFVSFSLLKGLGFIIASPLWARLIGNFPINTLSGAVFFGFTLFFIALILTIVHPVWLFVAYLLYGIAQAGSHLIWHMSGSIFSKAENSTPYSSVNVLMVGLRGAIAPPLGGLVTEWLGSPFTMSVSGLLCVVGMCLVASETTYTSFLSIIQKVIRKPFHR